jgi:hypothetical protein
VRCLIEGIEQSRRQHGPQALLSDLIDLEGSIGGRVVAIELTCG